jgi:hypothetical protein
MALAVLAIAQPTTPTVPKSLIGPLPDSTLSAAADLAIIATSIQGFVRERVPAAPRSSLVMPELTNITL